MKTTLCKLLSDKVKGNGEHMSDLVVQLLNMEDQLPVPSSCKQLVLMKSFDNGYGDAYPFSLTAWSKNRVYFTCEYDGVVSVKWVALDSSAMACPHNGHS